MPDSVIDRPEPQEIDEKVSMELRIRVSHVDLKGRPTGDEQCDNCRYYLEPTTDVSYCWHPALRVLVGAAWWCQCWDED